VPFLDPIYPKYLNNSIEMATTFTLAEPARNRIIRLTNVHFDADEEVIKDFFIGFEIQDQVRAVNIRTGTKSVVYVLFATVADRIRAQPMSGSHVLDREIKIQPAPKGNYKCKILPASLN
jgi:hypothetical protein